MAAVISPSDLDAFLKLAAYENLEATVVAEVTDLRRLKSTSHAKPALAPHFLCNCPIDLGVPISGPPRRTVKTCPAAS